MQPFTLGLIFSLAHMNWGKLKQSFSLALFCRPRARSNCYLLIFCGIGGTSSSLVRYFGHFVRQKIDHFSKYQSMEYKLLTSPDNIRTIYIISLGIKQRWHWHYIPLAIHRVKLMRNEMVHWVVRLTQKYTQLKKECFPKLILCFRPENLKITKEQLIIF